MEVLVLVVVRTSSSEDLRARTGVEAINLGVVMTYDVVTAAYLAPRAG
jgi:hypothetical protein